MKNISEQDKYIEAKKRVHKIKGFYWHLFWYVVVNIFILYNILRHLSPDEFHISMLSTAFFWGIGLAFHAYGVFGKNILFSKEWEDRKIKEYMDKDKNEYWK